MNIQLWNNELEIYDSESVMGDMDDEPIVKIWQTERILNRVSGELVSDQKIIFTIKEGYELKSQKEYVEECKGQLIFSIEREKE